MSGIGRGRGWLNINKNTKPGMEDLPETSKKTIAPTPKVTSGIPKIDGKFATMASVICQFNESDDGIILNQKLRHLIEIANVECMDADFVEKAFNAIYEQCLIDSDFSTRAMVMASTPFFQSLKIHEVKVRNIFIARFQKSFEARVENQKKNPVLFRNSIKMLGDFFNKARLTTGAPYTLLAPPMVLYLSLLLEAQTEEDLRLFTVQLFMNGHFLKDEPNIHKLITKVRHILTYNEKLSTQSKLWMLMALDLNGTRFSILPMDTYRFYLNGLGPKNMAQVKRFMGELCIQTDYENAALDTVHSNVNVLQQVRSPNESWESSTSASIDSSSDFQSDIKAPSETEKPPLKKSEELMNNIGTWQQPKNEKTPRPILGAGVRLQNKEKNNEEDTPNWDNKKKGSDNDWGTGKQAKNSKGWEHDDRFDNEYN